jgi:DNA mismatch repair protein MutS2
MWHMNSLYDQNAIEGMEQEVLHKSLILIELPKVLEEVSQHAHSTPGRNAVLEAWPEDDIDRIHHQLNLVGELKELISISRPLSLNSLLPMEELLSRLRNLATVLDIEEILAVKDVLDLSSGIKERLIGLENRYRLLVELAEQLVPLPRVQARIDGVLDERGLVRSDASFQLMQIREKLRKTRSRIQKALEATVQDRELSHIVQEDYITLRNDRYVVLLRPEFKGYLEGIVHDHSRSGSSVYVEPLHIVELNNETASLLDEEREEIRRIFKELTEDIRNEIETLTTNYRSLYRIDAVQARALYAEYSDSIIPELVEKGFSILGARHPLLIADDETEVVPMDIIQESETNVTVISGANMGGKTVALKIAGLFPAMVRCGVMLPAREGTKIHPFSRIMVDLGDDQDIRSKVSSFSGHMQRITAIMNTARPADLVLLDELGGATDPEEGSALAMAILDELSVLDAKVVVTTHLTHLKAYALGKDEVANVSVEFHPDTLEPTYRLLYDLPGESHAIDTAERIGIPSKVISLAKQYRDGVMGGASELMERLKLEISSAEERRLELEATHRELEEHLLELQSDRDRIVEDFRRQARELIRNAEKKIGALHKALKEKRIKGGPKYHQEIKYIRNEIEEGLGTPLEKPLESFHIGDQVKVGSLGQVGMITSLLDKGRVEVTIGTVKIRADLEELTAVHHKKNEKSSSKTDRIRIDMPIARPRKEVNIIGLRVEDALPIVDRAVDEAVLGGLSSLQIVHGKGTGRLRKAVWDFLSNHSLVTGLRPAAGPDGGIGATVVDLRTD